ncbi:DUF2155 domain-containing protein [Celeribacter arenosi]|uniref:DUF2155 domain-containing protein n=1 Tax=Celeribacter arenosi TaxID=792649 RepID=A0ABP7JVH1_9RHOB
MKLASWVGVIAFGVAPVWAQDTTAPIDDDLATGVDQILIQPLEDDGAGGFGAGGLTLEDLQSLPSEGFQRELNDITTELQERVVSAPGATLRALDRLTGQVEDLTLKTGEIAVFGRIAVRLDDCRFPEGNPSGDAYVHVVVAAEGAQEPVFTGWMVASSPALNAMDHARYDVWPLSCSTS